MTSHGNPLVVSARPEWPHLDLQSGDNAMRLVRFCRNCLRACTKRKITVTVDETLMDQLDSAGQFGASSLSAVVNQALAAHVDRLARRAALADLLKQWETDLGPVSDDDTAYARAAFDHLDGASGTSVDVA